MAEGLVIELSPDQVERIAERAAELVLERQADAANAWLRGADAIAYYVGCRRDRIYALSSAGRIPVQHDGSALVARRSELDEWIIAGGGKRP